MQFHVTNSAWQAIRQHCHNQNILDLSLHHDAAIREVDIWKLPQNHMESTTQSTGQNNEQYDKKIGSIRTKCNLDKALRNHKKVSIEN